MTASPGDGEHAAREGYYPDPSIPGYVRYWNGASWVPGTSRPAAPAVPAVSPAPAEETGPVVLDDTSATEALPEPLPEPEPGRQSEPVVWQADPAHQAGFGGPRDHRVSWGSPAEPEAGRHGDGQQGAEPAAGHASAGHPAGQYGSEPAAGHASPGHSAGQYGSGPGVGHASPGHPAGQHGSEPAAGHAAVEHPAGQHESGLGAGHPAGPHGSGLAAGHASAGHSAGQYGAARPAGISLARTPAAAAAPATRLPAQAQGILSARSPAAAAPAPLAAAPAPAWPDAPGGSGGGSGMTSSWPEAAPRAAAAPAVLPAAPSEAVRAPGAVRAAEAEDWVPPRPAPGSRTAGRTPEPARRAAPEPARRAAPEPARRATPEPARRTAAEADEAPRAEVWAPRPAGVRPSVPKSADAGAAPAAPAAAVPAARPQTTARAVFERMAERAVRPAGLFRRAVARLLDSLVLGAVAAGAAWPLLPAATAHVQAKVDAARGSGRATTVWLLDSTIAGHLGLVLGAVLLFGVFYEALPTARWGRTPGKKLLGVRVLATATLRPPTFGAALRRWLVYAFLGLPGSLWCLVDRPRRQAWHDKAAKTYVAR
ncbi:RDD family protein [Streptomyces sp. NBC_01408]|uniref:RDD family protein n=1 Tax=Streptomyces sp. NBC_01408 TaxID=2903855 RepID=UPI0022501A9E|nr:RDD family protein [Streptomyces sp. NBC_01408]MCX4693111.1 RDD family protein [Streptomyces sp. NBC_01408]